jgi:hypothetical protein
MDDVLTDNEDVVAIEDGTYVFWPTQNNGYYRAQHLRQIADWLDQKNKEIEHFLLDKSEL